MDKKTSPLKRLWQLMSVERQDIYIVYLYAMFNGLVNLSLPLGIQAIINLIVGGQVSTSWIVLVSIVITGIIVAGWMQVMQLRIIENMQQKIFTRFAFEFSWKFPRMKLEALDRYYPPELVNRFFDTMVFQKGISKLLIDFSIGSIQVIFGVILLSFYHPFFIVFSIILILLIVVIILITGKPGLNTSLKESKYKYEVAHWLEEIARSLHSFKMAGVTDLPIEETDRKTIKYLDARNKHFKVLMTQYILMIMFKVFIAAALLLVGGYLVINQQMNIGQFVAAEIIIILVLSSVEKLILSLQTVYDTITSLEKIGSVLDIPLEKNGALPVSDLDEGGVAVSVNDLTFSFPDSITPIIRNIDMEIKAGEKIVIVGSNGSGKSTFLRLIAGLFEDYKGLISFNQIPLRNLDKTNLRSIIGNSIAEDELFEGTVLQNLTLGRKEISLKEAKNAIKAVGLEKYVNAMPLGYDTIIGTMGRQLPKSIKQKIILARCIAVNPKLILIEDWAGNNKSFDQTKLHQCLFDSTKKWTLIAISNNPEFIQYFDRIAIMENGEITAMGTFEELLKTHDLKTFLKY